MQCKNDARMRMIGVNKLNDKVEVDFDVQRNLPDCRKINASKYVSTTATNPVYNRYAIPANQFECMNKNCVNSGTLMLDAEGKSATYKTTNGEDFSAGVIAFYVTSDVTAVEVTLSDTEAGTNAWKYTAHLGSASADGYKVAVVDLTETPTEVGSGWTPSEGNVYITIKVVATAPDGYAGISSIAIFDDMEDFQTSTHVKVGCITGIDGTWDLDVAESACFANGYDTNTKPTIEKTITGTKITGNYWRLNPMYKRGSATEGFDIVTVERTIVAGTGYGSVTLDDMNQEECGFLSVQLADSPCVNGDAELEKLSIPTAVVLDGNKYLPIDNGDGTTSLIFHSSHVGSKVLISYPRKVDVEEFVLSFEDVNEVRTRMSYVRKHTDGYRYRFVFNNVLVTSFPDALTEDDTEFAFTIRIEPEESGVYGHAYRIID